jgi:hypothetical protein
MCGGQQNVTDGSAFIGATGQIDSRPLNSEELAQGLDCLLATEQGERPCWQFSHLVRILDRVTKVNPHQHITGSVGGQNLLQRVVQVYRQDPIAGRAFLEYVDKRRLTHFRELEDFFQQPDDALLRWFERQIPLPGDPESFKEADDHLNLARLAFQSRHGSSFELLREAYRTVALENLAHGVAEVWFRTSLGDHEDDSFASAAQAAIQGAKQAELEAEAPLKVRFLVGLRKRLSDPVTGLPDAAATDTRAASLVAALGCLRQTVSDAGAVILGIDSVGMDSDWNPRRQSVARSIAAWAGLHIAVHFGESWREGGLLSTLERLEELVRYGLIHQLDNANALFAVRDPANPLQSYSQQDWQQISHLQHSILQFLATRGIALGINPTSNDLLTRSLRRREGWRFRALNEPLGGGMPSVVELMFAPESQSRPLLIVVGNDNSRLYPSRIAGAFLTVSEELAHLWEASGSVNVSVFGQLPTRAIARLMTNGFALTETARDRRSFQNWSGYCWPSSAQLSTG